MRTLIAAALLFAVAAPAAAQTVDAPSGRYEVDLAHASITWRVKHLGLSMYTARFAKFTSTVELDAAKPAASKLSVVIDPNSVRTDFPFADKTNFDKEVAEDPRFLESTKYPEIRFVSTGITTTGAKTARIAGNLTLRGVTRPVVLDATLNGTLAPNAMFKQPKIGVSATAKIKRSEFGMTFGQQFVGDEVELIIEAEYAKAA